MKCKPVFYILLCEFLFFVLLTVSSVSADTAGIYAGGSVLTDADTLYFGSLDRIPYWPVDEEHDYCGGFRCPPKGPISWKMKTANDKTITFFSEYILSTLPMMNDDWDPQDLSMKLENTDLYKQYIPEFFDWNFTSVENSALTGMRLSDNEGYADCLFTDRLDWTYYMIHKDLILEENALLQVTLGCSIASGEETCAEFYNNLYRDYGFRPAFDLDSEKILLISPAAGGKNTPAGSLDRVVPGESKDRKLTLLDPSRDFYASVSANVITPGTSLSVEFSGAREGENEYVSAVLCDRNGEVRYYGKFANGQKAGSFPIETPADAAPGEYSLKLFSEQINGDKLTDYASAFAEARLKIVREAGIIFHSNYPDGTDDIHRQEILTDTEITLDKNPFSFAGYHFAGWNTAADGSGTAYPDEAEITLGDDLELYAIWEKAHTEEGRKWFRLSAPLRELPRTGLAGTAAGRRPSSVRYRDLELLLQVPSLDLSTEILSVPLQDGTYPVEWLGTKAGLLAETDLPGEGHSVIAAHNTLNADEFGPFALLGALREGDLFFIQDSRGNMLTYRVFDSDKITETDVEALIRTAERFENTVTLLTCEDERSEGGYASRRIVTAHLISASD